MRKFHFLRILKKVLQDPAQDVTGKCPTFLQVLPGTDEFEPLGRVRVGSASEVGWPILRSRRVASVWWRAATTGGSLASSAGLPTPVLTPRAEAGEAGRRGDDLVISWKSGVSAPEGRVPLRMASMGAGGAPTEGPS